MYALTKLKSKQKSRNSWEYLHRITDNGCFSVLMKCNSLTLLKLKTMFASVGSYFVCCNMRKRCF